MSAIAQARHEMIRDYHYANPEATVSDVAEAVGVTRSYVRCVKGQYRLAIPADQAQFPREDDERILRAMRLRRRGHTFREISEAVGISAPAITQHMQRIAVEYAASERADA